MSRAFLERLEEKRSNPLGFGVSKYQHIERLGHEDVEGLLDGEVWVSEKLDGANGSVFCNDIGQIVIASRNQIISSGGFPSTGFRGFVEYVLGHPGFSSLFLFYSNWILRGEWLVHHSILYNKVFFGHFYVFDVQLPDGSYLHPNVYEPVLASHGIRTVPTIIVLNKPTIDQLAAYLERPSDFGAEHLEGIVVKRYDYQNKYGRVTWGKLVRDDFKQQNKLMFRAGKAESPELRFAAQVVTPHFVDKIINGIKDRNGTVSIRNMGEVIGRAWHDAFTEELWDFVKENHVSTFDFREARRNVEGKARELALIRFSGIPTIHGRDNNGTETT